KGEHYLTTPRKFFKIRKRMTHDLSARLFKMFLITDNILSQSKCFTNYIQSTIAQLVK
ncbi:17365_t:CDS:1, partial [Gigaspora rosea]